jgi:hypothetical protein
VGVGVFNFVANQLTVGDLRRTDIGFDFEFTTPVHENVAKFAHTLHDCLTGFDIRFDAEGWISAEMLERDAHFSSPFVFGSIAISITGSGNAIVFEDALDLAANTACHLLSFYTR